MHEKPSWWEEILYTVDRYHRAFRPNPLCIANRKMCDNRLCWHIFLPLNKQKEWYRWAFIWPNEWVYSCFQIFKTDSTLTKTSTSTGTFGKHLNEVWNKGQNRNPKSQSGRRSINLHLGFLRLLVLPPKMQDCNAVVIGGLLKQERSDNRMACAFAVGSGFLRAFWKCQDTGFGQ